MASDDARRAPSPSELFDLRGANALVVGASSGLGARMARVLASAGAGVALAARRRDRLEDEAAHIRASGAACAAIEADAAREGEMERAVAEAESALGALSLLVYVAGVSPLGRAERHARAKWDQALAVNLTGAFDAAQAVGARWIERGTRGAIVFVGSILSLGASATHKTVGYSASKAGLANLGRQLAVEWAPHGIRVNSILPGYFATEMTIDPAHGDIAPDQRARMETFTPMGRVGRVDEIDTALLFLASPASSFVTGALVPVDGGWTAW